MLVQFRVIIWQGESSGTVEESDKDREGKRAKVQGELSRRLSGRFHRLRQALWSTLGHNDTADHPDGDDNNHDNNNHHNDEDEDLFAGLAAAAMG